MAAGTVKVEGLRELQAAFRKIDGKLVKEFGNELKEVAEPVVRSAHVKVARYRGASIRTIRARRRGLNISVEQGARKVTGRRSDFGRLQLRQVLEPALDENRDGVITDVDRVLGRWADDAGF